MEHGPKFIPHPESSQGDFYVEKGQCLACGIPHVVAPDLMGWAIDDVDHCIWRKQPETPVELEQAIKVFDMQELGCHRYSGADPAILERITAECCDYPLIPASRHKPKDLTGSNAIGFSIYGNERAFLLRLWKRLTRFLS
jgi:hypothetical protein